MPIQVAVIVAIAVVFAAIVLTRQYLALRRYRGRFVIVCPDNHEETGVSVDARHAAASALVGAPELRLTSCSRWPERAGCGQPCLSQIAAAPEDCLVRNILAGWLHGKVCALCARPFGAVDWSLAKPGLLRPDGVSVEWSDVPADKLHETLASGRPVCAACHLANTLVRERPELIADRSMSSEGSGNP